MIRNKYSVGERWLYNSRNCSYHTNGKMIVEIIKKRPGDYGGFSSEKRVKVILSFGGKFFKGQNWIDYFETYKCKCWQHLNNQRKLK